MGRLFDPTARRPYGWFQGHLGRSRAPADEWAGGKHRQDAEQGRENKKPWWERSSPGASYGKWGEEDRAQSGAADAQPRGGGVRYFPCKSFVYAPTGWEEGSPQVQGVNDAAPEAKLELEHVYGYTAGWIKGPPSSEMGIQMGSDSQDNLRYLDNSQMVYYAAATCIVYDAALNWQRFFCGHDDDVTCLAVSPSRRFVASGQIGRAPKVCIWEPLEDSTSKYISAHAVIEDIPPAKLFERKVASVAFTEEDLVAVVGGDDANTISIFNWKTEEQLFKGSGGTSPVFLIRPTFGWQDTAECSKWGELSGEWGIDRRIQLWTQGAKHVAFWNVQREGDGEAAEEGEDGEKGGWSKSIVRTDDNPLCVCFVKSFDDAGMDVITGHQCGDISTWTYGTVKHKVKNAHLGGVTQVSIF